MLFLDIEGLLYIRVAIKWEKLGNLMTWKIYDSRSYDAIL